MRPLFFRLGLDDGEDQFLFPQAAVALNVEFLGQLAEFGNGHFLEFEDIQMAFFVDRF
jgi:hypothetical protein